MNRVRASRAATSVAVLLVLLVAGCNDVPTVAGSIRDGAAGAAADAPVDPAAPDAAEAGTGAAPTPSSPAMVAEEAAPANGGESGGGGRSPTSRDPAGAVFERVDFETGDLSQWRNPCNGNACGDVVRDGDSLVGRYVDQGKRTESAGRTDAPLGRDMHYRVDLKVDGGATVTRPQGGSMFQLISWRRGCWDSGWFHVRLSPDDRVMFFNHDLDPRGADRVSDVTIERDRWFTLEIDARWSKGGDGYLRATVDGEPVYDHSGPSVPQLDCIDSGPYAKAGTYAFFGNGSTLYVDDYVATIVD